MSYERTRFPDRKRCRKVEPPSGRARKLHNKRVLRGLMQIRVWLMVLCAMMLLRCSGDRPPNLGVVNGKLSACPNSPNCVSSQTTDKKRYVEPLRYQDTSAEARGRLVSLLDSMARTRIVTIKEDYIHAEFTSRIFRFVDDVELYFDHNGRTIHLRSASRTGYSDLGANRKRVEFIRTKFVMSTTRSDKKNKHFDGTVQNSF